MPQDLQTAQLGWNFLRAVGGATFADPRTPAYMRDGARTHFAGLLSH
jgi:hypothetical protein